MTDELPDDELVRRARAGDSAAAAAREYLGAETSEAVEALGGLREGATRGHRRGTGPARRA